MKLIKDMTEEEKKEYFTRRDEDGCEVYLSDILCGITHISEIPSEYRMKEPTSYIYAIRAARDTPRPTHIRFTELKIVERILLADIARLHVAHCTYDYDLNWLFMMYRDYFPSVFESCSSD